MTIARRHALAFAVALLVAAPSGLARQNPVSPAQDKPPAPPASGAISGTVVDGTTGAAVSGAIVTLVAPSNPPLAEDYQTRQMTDGKGRFVFMNLPDGSPFQITAAKYGYLDGGYGLDNGPRDLLRSITIANGAWVGSLRVPIWAPASISGTVRDENGEPVVGVFVRALARFRVAGRDELAAGPVTVTDDHGEYRLYSLMAGRYLIQVPSPQLSVPGGTRVPPATSSDPAGAMDVDETARLIIGRYPLPPPAAGGRPRAYAPVFHPSSLAVGDASAVDVTFGENRPGIDITLTPVPAVRVSGTVEGPPAALTGLTLRLLPVGMENLGLGSEVATAAVASNGAFAFLNVPAGSYILDAPVTVSQYTIASGATRSGGFVGSLGVALPAPPLARGMSWSSQSIDGLPVIGWQTADYRGATGANVLKYSARMPLTVGAADMPGVVVRLRADGVLRGSLKVELDSAKAGAKPPPRFFAFMDPAGGQTSLGRPSTSIVTEGAAEFEMAGLRQGEYFLRVQAGSGWLVKSIQWRGRDFTTTPFDASSADEFAGVTVTVTNAIPTLSGAVRASDGTVPESAMVVIFPAAPALRTNTGMWSSRLTSTPVLTNGTFRIATVPAGEYFVAAIDRSRAATWRNPETLAALERAATRIALNWGQAVNQDLTLAVIR